MRSPFAAGLGPAGRRGLYLLGLIAAVKAAGLLGIAEGIALGIAALADGTAGWRDALLVGAVSVLLRALAAWAGPWLATRLSIGAKERMRARLAEHLVDEPTDRVGAVTVLATRGLDDLDPYFRTVLPATVSAAVVPLMVGARILSADWLSALVIVLTVPLIPVFMILIGMHTQERVDKAAGTLARLSDSLVELARGLPVLVGLGRVEEQTRALTDISEAYRRATLRTLRTAFLSSLALELIATISVAVVAVEVGIRLIGGDLSLYLGLVVLVLAPECFTPLREVGAAFHASRDGLAAFDRVEEIVGARTERKAARTAQAAIEVHGFGVRYDGRAENAVADVSFEVAPGEIVALTGPSGSGKSTLLRAIAGRLVSTSASTTGETATAGAIAWMPQHPHAVADTVRDELALYADGVDEPDAAIDELLIRLRLGAVASADPGELSPGELRRVAFARALLRVRAGAAAVILDEPTAHLDAATARIVEGEIGALRGTVAVLLASHEPEVVALADRQVRLGAAVRTVQRDADEPEGEGTEPLPERQLVAEDSGRPLGALVSLLRPILPKLALGLFLGVLAALFAAALTAVSGWLIVRAAEEPAIMYLLPAIVGVRFFGIGRSVLRYAERLATHDAVFSAVTVLRGRLWTGLAAAGASSRSLARGGTALDLLVVTADQVRDLLPRVVQPVLVSLATVAAALVAGGLLHAEVVPVYAGAFAVAALAAPLLALGADRAAARRELATRSRVTRRYAAFLAAADDLAANGLAGRERALLRRLDERAGNDARRSAFAAGLGEAIVVGALGAAAFAAIAASVPAVQAGSLPVAVVGVLALLPLALVDPLVAAVAAVQNWPALSGAVGRLEPVLTAAATPPGGAGTREIAAVSQLRLEGLSAAWPGAAGAAFSGVDASVERGEWLGVVGPSGSGKSTLLTVLLGYLPPASGRYLVDGVDARELDGRALRRRVSWAPQEAHLFASTIRGNLLLARSRQDAPDEAELREALARVRLLDLVDALPDGLDTRIGSEGTSLSGGERQRLAVARTLLTRSDVVLLDEPSAHLDEDVAERILDDLHATLGDRAVVLVSHRSGDHDRDDRTIRLDPRGVAVPA